MPALKISIQLASLRQPLRQGLASAARLGAAAVELDARGELRPATMSETGLRQIRKLLADYNLRVSALSYPTRRGYDVADELEARVAGTKEALKLAHALGASVVVNHVGRVPAEPSGPQWNMLVDVLSDLGRYSQRAGALLAAQTGSESGADFARLIDALPPGSVGVDLDPANLIANGFSPLEALDALGRHVLHVHATDAVRDLARGRGIEVALGRGTADFPALLGKLEEQNYRGYLTIQRLGAADPVQEIAAAVEYLRSL